MGADLLMPSVSAFQGRSCTALLGAFLRASLSSIISKVCQRFLWSQRVVRKVAKLLRPPVSERRLGWILTFRIFRKTDFSCQLRKLVASHPKTNTAQRDVWSVTLGNKTSRPSALGKSSSVATQQDLARLLGALLLGREIRNRENITGKSVCPGPSGSSCCAVWTLMLPCSDQDGLLPEEKRVSVRCLDSRYFNKTKFISNTLADIHSFSWHGFYQSNCSFISTTSPISPLSRDWFWQNFCFSWCFDNLSSYSVMAIFSPSARNQLQGRQHFLT